MFQFFYKMCVCWLPIACGCYFCLCLHPLLFQRIPSGFAGHLLQPQQGVAGNLRPFDFVLCWPHFSRLTERKILSKIAGRQVQHSVCRFWKDVMKVTKRYQKPSPTGAKNQSLNHGFTAIVSLSRPDTCRGGGALRNRLISKMGSLEFYIGFNKTSLTRTSSAAICCCLLLFCHLFGRNSTVWGTRERQGHSCCRCRWPPWNSKKDGERWGHLLNTRWTCR